MGRGPRDAEEIKEHPFFNGINWEKLKERKIIPPWKPHTTSETDLKNIDNVGL